MRRLFLAPALGLALLVLSGPGGSAQQPGLPALPPGVAPVAAPTAAPASLFPVTPQAGPWMICAATYSGPDSPELARQVVLELRNRHHLSAYIFNHADQERQRQQRDYERLRQLYPNAPIRRRTVRILEQCAVLVGGYASFEEASAVLPKIKQLPLPTLKLDGDKIAYDMVNRYSPDPATQRTKVERAPLNPFAGSMVVRNPTVPAPPRPVQTADPFWKELNADEPYSLLKCPKRYTLVVKEYPGMTVVQPASGSSSFLKMLGFGSTKPEQAFSAAARQAAEVAKLMEKLGFKPYILHTRYSSIVSVGAFDNINDAEMQRVQRQLAALKFSSQGRRNDPVGLMARPMPMEVPRP